MKHFKFLLSFVFVACLVFLPKAQATDTSFLGAERLQQALIKAFNLDSSGNLNITLTGDLTIPGSILANTGILTLGGVGTENLTFDFGTADRVILNSTSGISRIQCGVNVRWENETAMAFGTSGLANMLWSGTQAIDSLQLGLYVGHVNYSGYFSIMDVGGTKKTYRAPLAISANPVLRIYATGTDALDYLEFYHDQASANIVSGIGKLQLKTATGDIELMPSSGVVTIRDGADIVGGIFGDDTFDQFGIATASGSGHQVLITTYANLASDHDHAVQANPTVFGHSTTDPDTANDEWWSITHNITHCIFDVGKGNTQFPDGIRTIQVVDNVHDTTPTDAELDSAFGTPAALGRGFLGTVDDADGDTNFYLAVTSDASWYWVKLTKAL